MVIFYKFVLLYLIKIFFEKIKKTFFNSIEYWHFEEFF